MPEQRPKESPFPPIKTYMCPWYEDLPPPGRKFNEKHNIWQIGWKEKYGDEVSQRMGKTTNKERARSLYKDGMKVDGAKLDEDSINTTKELDQKSPLYGGWYGDATKFLREAWKAHHGTEWEAPPAFM